MPDWRRHIRPHLAALRLTPTREEEIIDELGQHLEDRWRELVAAGASEEDAVRGALAQLRPDALVRSLAPLHQLRQPPPAAAPVATGRWMRDLWLDLRYAVRMLRKEAGFALTAILILGVGIGASTAMFSVVDAVLLRPLPYPSSERVVTLWGRSKEMSIASVSIPDYRDWRQRSRSFEQLALIRTEDVPVRAQADPHMATSALVTASFFPVFNRPAQIGRTLAAADDRPDAAAVAVVSHRFWQARLAADPSAIGRTMLVADQPHTIVGVMPAAFDMPVGTDVWLGFGPQSATPGWQGRANRPGFMVMGVLAPGIDAMAAQRDMSAVAAQLATEYSGSNASYDVVVTPLLDSMVGGYRRLLWMLLAGVGLFLLIACANVGNMLLVRGTQRQRELAVRTALGATTPRILRQLGTEMAALAAAGVGLGILLAWAGLRALPALGVDGPPRFRDVAIDMPVLAFAIALGAVTSLVAGLWPAWRVSAANPKDAMDSDGRTGTSRSTRRLQAASVVMQVAVTLTLIVSGVQLVRSFERARTANLGFVSEQLWSARVRLPSGRYEDPLHRQRIVEQFLAEAQLLAGVEAAAISSAPPLAPGWQSGYLIEGQQDQGGDAPYGEMNRVSPSYFRTLGVTMLRGRDFLPDDRQDRPRVAIVDEAMAERAWPGQDPLGKRFFLPGPNWRDSPLTVVGVAPTLRLYGYGLAPRNAQIYLPVAQSSVQSFFVVARGPAGGAGLENGIRRAARRLDADIVVSDARMMTDRIGETVSSLRLTSVLGIAFAVLALILAAAGLHAVIAYDVAQRLREMGLRLALGAEPRAVVALVLRKGLTLIGIGLLAGLGIAVALTQSLRSVLVDLEPVDAWSVSTALVFLAAAGAFACWRPARRASQLSPLDVLRRG